jgi:hypothetical protein
MKRFAIALGLLALAACGSQDSGTVETENGTVEYTTENNGDAATVTLKSDEGEVTIASGANQDVRLPAGFSIFPGATVIASNTVSHSGGSGVRLTMTTDASPVQVVEFYGRQARVAGITNLTEAAAGGQAMIGGKGEDGTEFALTAIPGENETTANLIVTKGF